MAAPLVLQPHLRDLGGGMRVRRLLPAMGRQGVGPFVFFDHFGPLAVQPADNHDVRPHPHIGLATVTYLFEGAIMHRDSLGVAQRIEPGAINWMTAGRGIVHSERRPGDLAAQRYTNHGLQLWAALPLGSEEVAPAFVHTPARDIPEVSSGGVKVRVLVGSAFGATSPVKTFRPTLYLDAEAAPGGTLVLGNEAVERAVYSVSGRLEAGAAKIEPQTMAVFEPGSEVRIAAPEGARYVVIGGEPLDGHRHMWWNFVSSEKERIEQAKRDWAAQRMGTIPGETEWIPLPG